MAKITLTQLVRAPKEKVADYFAAPDLYAWVHQRYYKSFKILEKRGNVATVAETWEIGGRLARFTHRIVLRLPHAIEMEIVAGDGKGSREVITFEEAGDCTRITYQSDFRLGGVGGAVLGWLARGQMKMMMEEMAEEDRRFLEGSWPARRTPPGGS